MAISINGRSIPNPSTLRLERYNITNLERNAAGLMVGDLIAKKRKLVLSYEAISGADLDDILDLIWETNQLFFTVTFDYNGTQQTMRAYTGAIPQDLHRAGKGRNWVWKGVSIDFIEQ